MTHSGKFLCFIVITSFCFFITLTVLCSSSQLNEFATTENLHRRTSRRALSTQLIQHDQTAIKVLDATKRLLNQIYKKEEPMKVSSDGDGDNGEGELIYHVDYQGVTTHPGPNPKHGKP